MTTSSGMDAFEKTSLWRSSLARDEFGDADIEGHKERLRSELHTFRQRVSGLVSRISAEFPQLTIHDVTHLDALWETASIIAGTGYPLNPMEAFVLGGAILLHDAAHCFEAYDGGREAVRKTTEWRDAFHVEKERHPSWDIPTVESAADFAAVRVLHAREASELAEREWKDAASGHSIFLINDPDLRKRYGALIGEIAASHHWSIEDVQSKLRSQVNAPGALPQEWRIDPVKIACLLRCADAAHIDDRRAPDFMFALLRRAGVSADHWKAQNWLSRLDVDQNDTSGQSVIITSTHPFGVDDTAAWWVAYDAVSLFASELRASNELLFSRPQVSQNSPAFKVRRVTGADTPSELAQHIQTTGWEPTSAMLHVGNVEKLVQTLGGASLYGEGIDKFAVVVRELIQNARDAVVARSRIQLDYQGQILIRLKAVGTDGAKLEVCDDGVGMSRRILTGPLLDFGSSFWGSELVREEFPGLKSSGFQSVGKFGIGFYSTFMIADHVEIASRRFDEGLDSVRRLMFPSGISLRPIFSKASPQGFPTNFSTMVSLNLKDKFGSVRMRTINSGRADQPTIDIDIENYLAVVATGLDVRVDIHIEGEKLKTIHHPIGSLVDIPKKMEWLQSIAFTSIQANPMVDVVVAEAVNRLRFLEDGGRVVGLAALSNRFANMPFLSTATVGGLTAQVSRGSAAFVGYLDYGTRTAKRDQSDLSASPETLRSWASEQIELLKSINKTDVDWYWTASSLANLNIDPTPILRVPLFMKPNDLALWPLEKVFEILAQTKIAAMCMGGPHKILDSNSPAVVYNNLPTIRPLGHGNLLSVTFDSDDKSIRQYGLVPCLLRYGESIGKPIKYEIISNVLRSQFGPLDAIVLSL